MSELLDSDLSKKLGISCFNTVWNYIDKTVKSKTDLADMVNNAHASFWFWKHYENHSKTNLSIGLWQLSRVYALCNDGLMAKIFSEECISISSDLAVDPFYLAYGYESLARSYGILENNELVKENIRKAKDILKKSKEREIEVLLKDLEELESKY